MTRGVIWDSSQRAVVAGFVLLLSILFGVMCWLRPATVSDPQPIDGSRASELIGKLDPNVASAGDLSAIPNLGEKRAKAIVGYREDAMRRHPGEPVFRSSADLMRVPGIGVAISANMEPFVIFQQRGTGVPHVKNQFSRAGTRAPL